MTCGVWQAQIAATWPAGNATSSVLFTAGTPAQYTIQINWTEPGEPLPLNYVLNLQQ